LIKLVYNNDTSQRPLFLQLPEQQSPFTEQLPFLDKQDPVGLPTGAGVTGLGVVFEAEHEGFHQQRFPPF